VEGASIDDESNGPPAGRIGVATVTVPTETDTAEAPNDETPDTTRSTTTNTSVLNDRTTAPDETETRCGIETPPEREEKTAAAPDPTKDLAIENHRRYAHSRSRVNPLNE
jgi:hypothetical protein